jgi:hypothetical protein
MEIILSYSTNYQDFDLNAELMLMIMVFHIILYLFGIRIGFALQSILYISKEFQRFHGIVYMDLLKRPFLSSVASLLGIRPGSG